MWCDKCHAGSQSMPKVSTCPNCGGVKFVSKCPFPARAEGMGNGKPSGKTEGRKKGLRFAEWNYDWQARVKKSASKEAEEKNIPVDKAEKAESAA